MVRESLDPAARRVVLFATSEDHLVFQWRLTAGSGTDVGIAFEGGEMPVPITLRLTRGRDTLHAAHSTDEGKTFPAIREPFLFDRPLPEVLRVGLVITSEDPGHPVEARVSGLGIRRL